ncbi:hypothetical protein BE04_20315 [Sorangium cellulosum]|uniref:CRISPR type III-associated protein domain-containing protein n=1 Tax=Sorangium cellulosum TaxID=56 RepID=A0A150PQ84_SORCE|nr:hypothetical protein BE04_20315 [Sorangium cellulosum]
MVCGIYTVSPLHVSTGQAEGAIDLPVTKEPHTGFPVIPASSLKGVARDAFEHDAKEVKDDAERERRIKDEVHPLFGPKPKSGNQQGRQEKQGEGSAGAASTPALFAGALVFTEARLVAYAARSLNRPFLYVTCRLVLERLGRDLRAAGIGDLGSLSLPAGSDEVLVADKSLARAPLVIEDLVYLDAIAESATLKGIAESLARLLPDREEETRNRVEKGLVVIPDGDFSVLVRRLPVRARIRLDDNKTTSGDDGNLWYEEQVPADCLFVSMIGARRGRGADLDRLRTKSRLLEVSQIGGNETVGEGICLWRVGCAPATAGKGAT